MGSNAMTKQAHCKCRNSARIAAKIPRVSIAGRNLLPLAIMTMLLLTLPASASATDVWTRFWSHLLERPDGPMSFRFILQPVMAAIAAFHDGVKDAATGRSPYFWTVLTDPGARAGRLREGFKATAKILCVGLAIDLIYQIIEFKSFYPMESVAIALLLAFIPYLLLRGPIARIAKWHGARKSGQA